MWFAVRNALLSYVAKVHQNKYLWASKDAIWQNSSKYLFQVFLYFVLFSNMYSIMDYNVVCSYHNFSYSSRVRTSIDITVDFMINCKIVLFSSTLQNIFWKRPPKVPRSSPILSWPNVLQARMLWFFNCREKCCKIEYFESSGWQIQCFES